MPRDPNSHGTRTADSIKKAIGNPPEQTRSSSELSESALKQLKRAISILQTARSIEAHRKQILHVLKKIEQGGSATRDFFHKESLQGVEGGDFYEQLALLSLQGYKGATQLIDKPLVHDVMSSALSLGDDVISTEVMPIPKDVVVDTVRISEDAVKTVAKSIVPPKEQLAWTAHALETAVGEPLSHILGELSPAIKVWRSMQSIYDLRLEASKLREKIKDIKPSLDQALEEHYSLTQELSEKLQAELTEISTLKGFIPSIIHPATRINAEDRYTVERYISMRFKLEFKKRGDALKFLKEGNGKNIVTMSANEIAYMLGLLDPDEDKSDIEYLASVLKNEIEKFEKEIKDKQDIGDTTKEKLIDMYKVMIEQSVTRARLERAIRLFELKEETKQLKALLSVGAICCVAATGVAGIVGTFGAAAAPLLIAGHAIAAASSTASGVISAGSKVFWAYDSLLLKDKHEASLRHDPLASIDELLESSFVKKIKQNDTEITASIVKLNEIIANFIKTKSDVESKLHSFEGSERNAEHTKKNMEILDNLIGRLTKYRDNLTLESRELYLELLNDDLSINFDKYEANLERLDKFNKAMKGSIRELSEQYLPLAQQISEIVNLECQSYASYEGDQSMISHEKKIKESEDKLRKQQETLGEAQKNILKTLDRAENREADFQTFEQTDLPKKETESPKHGRRSRDLGEQTAPIVRQPVLSSGRSRSPERSALPGMPSGPKQTTDVADHTEDVADHTKDVADHTKDVADHTKDVADHTKDSGPTRKK